MSVYVSACLVMSLRVSLRVSLCVTGEIKY